MSDGEFEVSTVPGAGFEHLWVRVAERRRTASLNVYLDGDGQPFVTPTQVALDPTPQRSVALALLKLDPGSAVYVSRPCYHGLDKQVCGPRYWTTARYSADVVASLAEAISRVADMLDAERLTLIGHSGGGALAVLVASRLPRVETVVTLSGNLDPDRWTELHNYSPLVESQSPLDAFLPQEVSEWHLIGADDDVVPPEAVSAYVADTARQRSNFHVCSFPGCHHEDCWWRNWPMILESVSSEIRACESLERRVKK